MCSVYRLRSSSAAEDENHSSGVNIFRLSATVGGRWNCGLLKFVTCIWWFIVAKKSDVSQLNEKQLD